MIYILVIAESRDDGVPVDIVVGNIVEELFEVSNSDVVVFKVMVDEDKEDNMDDLVMLVVLCESEVKV